MRKSLPRGPRRAATPPVRGAGPTPFAMAAAAGLSAPKRGDLAEAVAQYGAAYALVADGDIAHNLGTALRDLKRGAEAAEWFRRCLAAKPGHALAQANLGLCLHDLGDDAAAIAAFDAALALRPGLEQALLGRAATRRRMGDPAGAALDLEALLAQAPGHVAATLELARRVGYRGRAARIRGREAPSLRAGAEARSGYLRISRDRMIPLAGGAVLPPWRGLPGRAVPRRSSP